MTGIRVGDGRKKIPATKAVFRRIFLQPSGGRPVFAGLLGRLFLYATMGEGKMKKSAVFGLAFVLLSAVSLQAAPPHPDLAARLKKEGKWEDFVVQYKSWKGKLGYPNPNPYRARFSFSGKAAAGQAPPDTLKVVVIYAAPSNRPTSADGLNVTQAQLQAILFGANPTGNFTDYYKEISYGQTVVVGTVFGPYTLPQTNAYYTGGTSGRGSYPNNAQKFVEDAVVAADPFVDFSQFDANQNGAVDGLFIIHSGPGAEWTGSGSDIWSHAWTFTSPPRDGKTVHTYAIQPEQQPGPIPIQIGVFCHEAGHSLFGLPDLYDTDGSSSGIGEWCLMAGGNYQNNSRTPAHLSPWCKKDVGWLVPTNLTANQTGVSLPTVQFTPLVYRLWKHGNGGSEYFLVENRSKRGFDSFLPGPGGLLIWHIDEGASNNNNEPLYLVALEQADGLFHLENNIGRGDGGDPFPGNTNNRSFTENSNPNSQSHEFQPTQVAVTNISNLDSVMTADLQVTYTQPLILLNRSGAIFTAIYKGAPSAAKSLTVTNDGGGTLNWTADWNSGWLLVTPDSATAPTNASISIASTNIAPGTYADTISITSLGALNTPQKVLVSLQVTSIRGDLNHDGFLTAADVVAQLNCVFLNPAGPECELFVADINCDGQLTAVDAVFLLGEVYLFAPQPC